MQGQAMTVGLKSVLILSVSLNVYYVYTSIQSGSAPDSDKGQLIHQPTNHLENSLPPVADAASDQQLNLPAAAETGAREDTVECEKPVNPVNLATQDDSNGMESEAQRQHRQDYLMEYEQQTEYAYTQIQYLLQNAAIKGAWDESDQQELQRYTPYITPKTLEDLIIPFLNNSSDMDMQVQLDFHAFNNDIDPQ
jgi:hypothetical protein